MNRKTKLFAAGLLLAALMLAVGCATDENNNMTASPTDMFTDIPTAEGIFGSGMPLGSAAPLGSVAPTQASTQAPASPGPTSAPNDNGAGGTGGTIDGFVSGKVLDPADAPDIVARLGEEFPEHTVQSMTFDLYQGNEAYKVTLQGDGELARVVYVLADGTVIIPQVTD